MQSSVASTRCWRGRRESGSVAGLMEHTRAVIVDREETTVLAVAGWGEAGNGLWRLRAGASAGERLPTFPNGFVMYECPSKMQVLVNEGGAGTNWSLRRIDDVERAVAAATWDGTRWERDGDEAAWTDSPQYVLVDRGDGHSGLVRLTDGPASIDPLDWFWDGPYDHGWQGLHLPVEIPGDHRLIFPVQRDSRPVVYDPDARRVEDRLGLVGGHGNPSIRFLRTRPEVWADDYDTMLRLRVGSWVVTNSRNLQPAQDGTQQFIGSFWIPHDERVCFVPRPFSGDVVVLDIESFAVTEQITLGRQPLEAVRLGNELVARDWKSRDLLRVELPDHLKRPT